MARRIQFIDSSLWSERERALIVHQATIPRQRLHLKGSHPRRFMTSSPPSPLEPPAPHGIAGPHADTGRAPRPPGTAHSTQTTPSRHPPAPPTKTPLARPTATG